MGHSTKGDCAVLLFFLLARADIFSGSKTSGRALLGLYGRDSGLTLSGGASVSTEQPLWHWTQSPQLATMAGMEEMAYQQCIHPACAQRYAVDEVLFRCKACGGLLDVRYDWNRVPVPKSLRDFEARWGTTGRSDAGRADFSGVWRFRELLPFAQVSDIITIGEGRTVLQQADRLAPEVNMNAGKLFLQYEGFNPTGSFKDNGMTAAFTLANRLGKKRVACASTGNTSASMAAFAAQSAQDDANAIQAIVFIGRGRIAFGKLAQALDYGALTIQVDGDFDACLRRVIEVADKLGVYLMNSVNPFRLEGQKAIMFRVLEGLDWEPPDWIIVPGGNLGNCSSFGKAFTELAELGLIKRVPRLAIINAEGADTLEWTVNEKKLRWDDGKLDPAQLRTLFTELDEGNVKAETVASAIEIGRPVNLAKALRAIERMDGVVRSVPDNVILEHKAMVGRYGYGCEPASAASVAGLHQLRAEGVIGPDERVVCILTGHALKDPDVAVRYHTGVGSRKEPQVTAPEPAGRWSNAPILVADDFEAIRRLIEEHAPEA